MDNTRANMFCVSSLDLEVEGYRPLGAQGLGIGEKLEPGEVEGTSPWAIGYTKGKGSGTFKFQLPLKEALGLLRAVGSPFGSRIVNGSATFTEIEGDGVETLEFQARVSSLDLDSGDRQKPAMISFDGTLTQPCSWGGETMVDTPSVATGDLGTILTLITGG